MAPQEVQEITNDEIEAAGMAALLLILLTVSLILARTVSHNWKVEILPEAAVHILVGMTAGLLLQTLFGQFNHHLSRMFDPNFFFVVLLPPIIFQSGYSMRQKYFFKNFGAIITLAVLGTLISTVAVAMLMYAGSLAGVFALSSTAPPLSSPFATTHLSVTSTASASTDSLSFMECLAFGALISATDPVSTLAVFSDMHVEPNLFAIVFGEAVLNDAVAIVLYETFEELMLSTSGGYTWHDYHRAFERFLRIMAYSTFLGIGFGMLCSLLLKHPTLVLCGSGASAGASASGHVDSSSGREQHETWKSYRPLEVLVLVLLSYIPFLVAEAWGLSGIVCILFNAITMQHYASRNLIFHGLSHLAEAAIFLSIGLSIVSIVSGYDYGLIVTAVLACLAARALHVYPLCRMLNHINGVGGADDRYSEMVSGSGGSGGSGGSSGSGGGGGDSGGHFISSAHRHMICFAGLRGAIAYALCMSFPGTHQPQFKATTMIVVLLTVFIMGGGTTAMLKALDIEYGVRPDDDKDDDKDGDAASSSSSDGKMLAVTAHLQWLDDKVLLPLFSAGTSASVSAHSSSAGATEQNYVAPLLQREQEEPPLPLGAGVRQQQESGRLLGC